MLDKLKIWIRFDAKHVPRNFIYGIKNLIKWFPIIYKDRDWDTFYIYEILRFKLKNQGIHTQSKRDSEQILLCTKLIRHCQDEYYNMEYQSYYENKITFGENLDKLKSDIKSYEINDVFLSENFSEYFKKYPRQYKKVISGEINRFNQPLEKKQEDGGKIIAMEIAHENQVRCKNLLFKILNQKIENWWD